MPGYRLRPTYGDSSSTGIDYTEFMVIAHHQDSGDRDEDLTLSISAVGATPTVFAHRGNFPNPFNPMTNIAFDLPQAARVWVTVYDASERLINTLLDENLGSGAQQVRWNGQDAAGQGVASGLYFSRVEAGDFRATRSMMLVR